MSAIVCLTLLIPPQAEDRLVDFLLSHSEAGIEFSMHDVAARGPLVKLDRGEDSVRGFATRVEAKLILRSAACEALIEPLRALLAGVSGGYWVTPVGSFESFPERTLATRSSS